MVNGLFLLKTSAASLDVVHVISFLCRTRWRARRWIGAWDVGSPADRVSGLGGDLACIMMSSTPWTPLIGFTIHLFDVDVTDLQTMWDCRSLRASA